MTLVSGRQGKLHSRPARQAWGPLPWILQVGRGLGLSSECYMAGGDSAGTVGSVGGKFRGHTRERDSRPTDRIVAEGRLGWQSQHLWVGEAELRAGSDSEGGAFCLN